MTYLPLATNTLKNLSCLPAMFSTRNMVPYLTMFRAERGELSGREEREKGVGG
jgi:hypothetical protein